MVRGPSPGPAPACQARVQLAAHAVELTDVAPPEAAQEGPRVDGAFTVPPRVLAVPPARSASSNRPQPAQTPPASSSCRSCSPAPGHRPVEALTSSGRPGAAPGWPEGAARHWPPIEGDLDSVGVVAWQHLLGAPFPGSVFCYKTIIPEAQEHLLAASGR